MGPSPSPSRVREANAWFGPGLAASGSAITACQRAVVVPPDRKTHSPPFLPSPFTLTMSDSDGDFSDELLELAGATEKKRKRREGSSRSEAKRRKAK